MSIPVTDAEFEQLLKAVGNDLIRAYRDKYFPARIILACPSVYSIENAASWVKPDKFCAFVANALQEQSPPPTPSTRRTELGSDGENPPSLKFSGALSLPTEEGVSAQPPRPSASSFSADSFESGESDNGAGSSSAVVGQKRKRGDEKLLTRASRPSARSAAGLTRVTRQCWVNHVETKTEAPENWRVPEAGQSVAYVLDLTDDPHEYKDTTGKELAMSAIIKHKCTDGWTGGSGGSLSKASNVSLLGEGVKCQKISHECRGAFVCSMSAPGLWDHYQRYDHDIEISSPTWSPPNDADKALKYAHVKEALRFYNAIMKEKCQFDGGRCSGRLILEAHSQVSVDGKQYFICCSAWTPGHVEHGHLSRQIPSHIDETMIQQLFETGRNNFSNTIVSVDPCTFQVPPRTGLKQKHCPHVHIREGRIVEGVIVHRPCPAKITIFSPVDHTLRKAAVIPVPGVPHNHPSHPSDKLTRRAKAALRAAGMVETTPGVVDCGPATPSVDEECVLNIQMGGGGPPSSLSPLTSGPPSITGALLPADCHIERFY